MEEGMVTHSSILAWKIPWTEEPGGLQSPSGFWGIVGCKWEQANSLCMAGCTGGFRNRFPGIQDKFNNVFVWDPDCDEQILPFSRTPLTNPNLKKACFPGHQTERKMGTTSTGAESANNYKDRLNVVVWVRRFQQNQRGLSRVTNRQNMKNIHLLIYHVQFLLFSC